MPQRDFQSPPPGRCPIQDGPRHAGQHQEDRQSRRSRRRPQQAQDHPTGELSYLFPSPLFDQRIDQFFISSFLAD